MSLYHRTRFRHDFRQKVRCVEHSGPSAQASPDHATRDTAMVSTETFLSFHALGD
jgi:hypothetical protein